MYVATLLMVLILVTSSYGFPSGAPATVCSSLTPNHGSNVSPQTGASSYTITPSATTYGCGDTINVTLAGANFRGFFCQPRPNVDNYAMVGYLSDIDNTVGTYSKCIGAAALTHNGNADKSSFLFSWTHTGTSIQSIKIVCTVVQTKLVYWTKLASVPITYSGSATTC